jgi:hypothetical protein
LFRASAVPTKKRRETVADPIGPPPLLEAHICAAPKCVNGFLRDCGQKTGWFEKKAPAPWLAPSQGYGTESVGFKGANAWYRGFSQALWI